MAEDLLAGIDVDGLEAGLVGRLAQALKAPDGAAPDVRVVATLREILGEIRDRQAVKEHRKQMDRLAERPVQMAEYLGRHGESRTGVAERLGRELTDGEEAAYDAGCRERALEVKSVELDRVSRGGKVEPWMSR